MSRLFNSPKALLVAAIIVLVVAVVVPICQMVGCDVGYMGFMHGSEFGVGPLCGGEWVVNQGPAGVVPPSMDSLLLVLLFMVVAAVVLLRPGLVAGAVRIVDESPPEPPLEPRGQRFRV